MRKILCLFGSHFWFDEGNSREGGRLLRSACCSRIKVLAMTESDWEIVSVDPPRDFGNGFVMTEAIHRSAKDDWWKRRMKFQRWNKCRFNHCAMSIRCEASARYCEFHHRHIEVTKDFSAHELWCGGVLELERGVRGI